VKEEDEEQEEEEEESPQLLWKSAVFQGLFSK
jgi:hypothetical protein